MITVNITEAKSQLCELIKKIEEGGEVQITRRGKPVAKMSAADRPQKPLKPFRAAETAELRALLPPLDRPSVELIREMRDEGW